jgi:flavin reductase (DIM6/NTAB) family NADH-FMN oxidoreductase RutF
MNEKQPVKVFHYLLHPYNTSLVTCCDAEGNPNIIAIAWLIPVSVNPPLAGISIGHSRFSYRLIRETGEFVINVAPYDIASQVLFCGRRSGRDVDKFTETGLTPREAQLVRPPIIEECIAHLECRVEQDVEAGDHHIVVGEVLAAYANRGILEENGLYRLDQIQMLFHLGRNCFTSTQSTFEELSV